MNIDSIFFIGGFLPVVLALYWLLPGTQAKNWLLLVASLVFCAFGTQGVLLLPVAGLVNYVLSRFSHKKWVMVLGVALNLAFLCAYKYLHFLLGDVLGLTQIELSLVAPLGISFFTFKAMSYLIDIYRDPTVRTRSVMEFLLYLSFFPQIAAGPITRFQDFGPQLQSREQSLSLTAAGLRRFAAGLGKKLILAATLGGAVDAVFAMEQMDIRLAWVGAIGYALQIYFDFSGYSDMAIGLGMLFGFRTEENFRHPYIANTVAQFWRRWHISLSSWFKDYLYIPLGGNRKGKFRAGVNKLIVFVLCGLWHGAGMTFLLWGLWHGLTSALESFGLIPAKKLEKTRVLGRVYTLMVVCLGFVMFRAASVEQGMYVLRTMFTGFTFTAAATVALHSILTWEVLTVCLVAIILCIPWQPLLQKKEKLWGVLNTLSYPAALVLLALCMLKLAAGGFAPFIYAQF